MLIFFLYKQKTAYEMRISDWSSDVFSSDLTPTPHSSCVKTHPHAAARPPTVTEFTHRRIELDEPIRDELDEVLQADQRYVCADQIGRESCGERECKYV